MHSWNEATHRCLEGLQCTADTQGIHVPTSWLNTKFLGFFPS